MENNNKSRKENTATTTGNISAPCACISYLEPEPRSNAKIPMANQPEETCYRF
jgi:hypothetical protein